MTIPLLFPSDSVLFFTAEDEQGLQHQLQHLLEHASFDEKLVFQHNCDVTAYGVCRLFVHGDHFKSLQQSLIKALAALQRGVRREGRIAKGVFYAKGNNKRKGKVAFVFPGQGCQFPSMGRALAKRYSTVKQWIYRLDAALLEEEGVAVSSYYFSGEYAEKTHPKLFDLDIGACIVNTMSLAYYELVKQLGIEADIFLGHSTGEFTALMASGRIKGGMTTTVFKSVMESFVVTYQKSLESNVAPVGTLYSVGMLDTQQIHGCFPKGAQHIYVALDNCPNQKIIFCPNEYAVALKQSLLQAGGMVEVMPFHYAYHTPLFSTIRKGFKRFYDQLSFSNHGDCEVYSCLTAQPFPKDDDGTRSLASGLLQQHVRFQETIETLYDQGVRTFIEIGPRNNISAFINDTLQGKDAHVISTGHASFDEVSAFLQMIGQLFVAGLIHDVPSLYARQQSPANESLQLHADSSDIKNNPAKATMLQVHFHLMQSFLEQQTRVMALIQQLQKQQLQKQQVKTLSQEQNNFILLGHLVSQEKGKACWQREVTLEAEPYLLDHAFGGVASLRDRTKTALPVIPFTMSMETTAEAASALLGKPYMVKRIFDVRALNWFVWLGKPMQLSIEAITIREHIVLCRIFNHVNGLRKLSFESKVELSSTPETPPSAEGFELSGRLPHPYQKDNFYLGDKPVEPWVPGQFHGALFQGVQSITSMGENGLEAKLKVLSRTSLLSTDHNPKFIFDPVMVDASMHLTVYWAHSKYGVDLTILPFQVDAFYNFAEPLTEGEMITAKIKIQFVQGSHGVVSEDAAYHFFNAQDEIIAKHKLSDAGIKHPPAGVSYHTLFPDDLAIRSDVEYFDQHGNLLAKLVGRLDKHFSLPVAYNRFTEHPSFYYLSEGDENIRTLKCLDTNLLYSSGKVWLYKLAWLTLTTTEWEAWLDFEDTEAIVYLSQVIVCKDLVREHCLSTMDERYAPVDLSAVVSGETWVCTPLHPPCNKPYTVQVVQGNETYIARFIRD